MNDLVGGAVLAGLLASMIYNAMLLWKNAYLAEELEDAREAITDLESQIGRSMEQLAALERKHGQRPRVYQANGGPLPEFMPRIYRAESE